MKKLNFYIISMLVISNNAFAYECTIFNQYREKSSNKLIEISSMTRTVKSMLECQSEAFDAIILNPGYVVSIKINGTKYNISTDTE